MDARITQKFTSYSIDQCEKYYKCDMMDFLDVGNLSVSKTIRLIRAGRFFCDEQAAAEVYDKWIDAGYSDMEIYIQLLEELDRDRHILKGSGMKISDLKEQFLNLTKDTITENTEVAPVENNIINIEDAKPQETKVDINGEVPVF